MSKRLSVAMIVRDEEQMAPEFLESARGLWDELVVVDTGSRDNTVALFTAAGAKVIQAPWQHNFSSARNMSLAHATGDWVLVLDADERVSPEFIAECRTAIQRTDVGALLVNVSNKLPYGHSKEAWLLRAWRHEARVQFHHAVREEADAALMVAARGLTTHPIQTPVVHLGYVRDRESVKMKKDRDAAILQGSVAAQPDDFYSWLKLLELARFWNDEVLWRKAAHGATDAIESLGRPALEREALGGELIALIAEGLFAPDSPAGLLFLESWAARLTPSPAFLLRLGFFREHQLNETGAKRDYEACLEAQPMSADPQLSRVAPHLGLARLALARDDADQALWHGRQALKSGPRDPEALLAVASLTRHLHGSPAFDAWIQTHESLIPCCPERDWAVGESLLTVGEAKRAVSFFRRAAGVPPGGPAGLRLAQALLAAGQSRAAEQLAHQLTASQPEAGLGVLLFDLAAGRSTTLDLELTPETAHAALKQWIDVLLTSPEIELIEKVRKHVGVLGSLFPWAASYLVKKSA